MRKLRKALLALSLAAVVALGVVWGSSTIQKPGGVAETIQKPGHGALAVETNIQKPGH